MMEKTGKVNAAFWNGKKVFLTGHTGFKGSWLSLWLHSMGAQVKGYALAPPTKPALFEVATVAKYVETEIGDIRDLDQLTRSMKEFFQSFSALRSENHLTTLYYRAKIIYGNNWIFYLVFNILSISYRFMIRYFQHTNPLKKLCRTQF